MKKLLYRLGIYLGALVWAMLYCFAIILYLIAIPINYMLLSFFPSLDKPDK